MDTTIHFLLHIIQNLYNFNFRYYDKLIEVLKPFN